jgi:hypothetical protein
MLLLDMTQCGGEENRLCMNCNGGWNESFSLLLN